MSTDILYRKAFIKVDDKRTILVREIGSSNCTQMNHNGREVLARDWGNDSYYSRNMIICDNETLLKKIDEDRLKYLNAEGYTDKSWGSYVGIRIYGISGCSFSQYKNYYANGIKNAKTIEDYAVHGITFSIHPYAYKFELLEAEGIEKKPSITFTSTEQMLKVIDEYLEYYKDTVVTCFITLNNEYALERMLKNQKFKRMVDRSNKPKEMLTNKYYTIVSIEEGGYFMRFTRRGYKYSFHSPAKRFKTETEADKYLSKMKYNVRFKVKYIEH